MQLDLKKKADPQTIDLVVTFTPETGGGSGIRTHDEVAPITVFKTVSFIHSAIPPYGEHPYTYPRYANQPWDS